MSDELFRPSEVAAESPKFKWLKKHDIKTRRFWNDDDSESFWDCWSGDILDMAVHDLATEDDAIAAWARKNEVRLWNEQ